MKRTNNPNKNIKTTRRVFILLAAIITAIAVAVTCALCINGTPSRVALDNAGQGEVETSATNLGALTSNAFITKVNAGQVKPDDYMEYTYNGSYYTIQLPIGTYKFEVWGARGGGVPDKDADPPNGDDKGGSGAHTWGEITLTAVTTYYIYCGGVGTNSTSSIDGNNDDTHYAGGYNGGGDGTGSAGPGGGGATDIRTTAGTANVASSYNTRIMVAGGGGGGTSPATSGAHQATSTTSLGNNGVNPPNARTSGVIYQGESGCTGGTTYRHSASYSNDEGGGGGGYYGGAIKHADDAKCGYAGSNYVSSSFSNTGNEYAVWRGAGKAQITVIKVNQIPTSRNATVTLTTRSSGSSTSIAASTLATDPEGTAVYFTANNSSNYDTSPTANNGLWVNGTTLATSYFDWTWNATTGATTLTITNVKRYPRNGVDGSTADGSIVLSTYVRDAFSTSTTQRGVSKISFTVTVPANTVTLKTGVVAAQSNVGTSVSMTAPADPSTATGIYNPNGANKNTLFIKKTLLLNETYTITAASLFQGLTLTNSNSAYNYDQAVISINSTTNISGPTRKYKVNEVDNGTNKITAYLANKTVIPNAYSQLTLVAITPDPNYQVLPVTLYVVEKTTAFGTSYPNVVPGIAAINLEIVFKMGNTRPVLKSGVSNLVDVKVGESKSLSLNTYYSDTDATTISSSTHTITGVTVPANEFVLLNRQGLVVAASNYNVGYTTGAAVSGDSDTFTATAQGTTATGFNSNIAYNATSPVAGTDRNQAFMSFTYANDTITVTGLRSSFSQYTSSRSNPLGHFYLLLHIRDTRETADNGIWLPLAFTVGNSAANSHTPVATVTSPNSLTSQTAVTTFPTAAGSVGDSFYFAPMAINYGGSHVVGKYRAADSNGANTGELTDANLQPLAIDGDNFSTVNGLATWGGGKKLNEFLKLTYNSQAYSSLAESVVKSVSTVNARQENGVWENQYIKAETIPIYIEKTMLADAAYRGGRVVVGSGTNANGFCYTSLATAADDSDYYTIDGLKITLKSTTMNRYVYGAVGVVDVVGNAVNTVNIAIRVKNTALQAHVGTANIKGENDSTYNNSEYIAKFGNPERDSAYSTYSYDGTDTPTFTYKIPLGATVIVTPYDLAYDYDMSVTGVNNVSGGFTLNGYTGRYNANNGMFTTGSTSASDGSVQFTGMFESSYQSAAEAFLNSISSIQNSTRVSKVSANANGTAYNSATNANADVPRDKLFFDRTAASSDAYTYNPTEHNNVRANIANATNFVGVDFGTQVKIGSPVYSVDFMLLTALNRTTQPAVIDLVVRDRFGSNSSDGDSSFTVRIVVEVVNTKPSIKNPAYFKELSVKPISANNLVVTPDTALLYANGNSVGGEEYGLMVDHDRDVPEYIVTRGIAIVNKTFIDEYNANELTSPDGTPIDNLTYDSFADMAEKYTQVGGIDLTGYITAEIQNRRELLVGALSSTKAVVGGVYVAFFVTDNNGGYSLGYVQIEVLNTSPVLNEAEETGFDPQNPLWNIESTSDADIQRRRYIVGSELAAEQLKAQKSALDIDIKLIAVDDDGLHNKLVLSQCTVDDNGVYNYSRKSGDNYDDAVPSIGFDASDFNGTASAVKVFMRTGSITSGGRPDGYTATLNFLIGNNWYTRAELINALVGGTINSDACFDVSGRFIVADWALLLHAQFGFESNVDVGVRLSLRDQAEFGGDTAGVATAFNSDRTQHNIIVDGRLLTTVYQHISQTGIRSINEYLGKDNNYYTVEYETVKYISTYDGSTSGDGTLAKADNSGQKYTGGEVEGAFRYTDTIEVPAAVSSGNMASGENVEYESVYVPMSYFGLLSTLVGAKTDGPDKGKVEYPTDVYVGYELAKNTAVDLNNINQILAAMTLSDGTYEWTGTSIKDNPYITIGTFDWYHDNNASTNSSTLLDDPYSSPYYNNRLAVVTKNPDGTSIGYDSYADNENSYKFGEGKILYLEEQATKLIEHNFGLTFTKKNVRTSTRNLSLTINLARYKGNMVALTDGEIAKIDRRTVEIKIHVENSKLDLYSNANENSDGTSKVKYDRVKGTYYVDLELASSGSATYNLSRKAVGANPSGDDNVIEYYDDDFGTAEKRDYAYFSIDSFVSLSQWQTGAAGYNRVMEVTRDGTMLANVLATSDKAQKSVANYFGVTDENGNVDMSRLSTLDAAGSDYKTGAYTANGGIYGVAGREGYSSYFNASLTDGGTKLNIMPVRKTYINAIAFTNVNDLKSVDKNSQTAVAAAYKKRGLVALYNDDSVDALTPSRVYYPFKVLIYDSFGVGFSDASYVALEFRITITNGKPTLKNVGEINENGRQYYMNLAVGNSAAINLYDIVYDPDIYTYFSNGIGRLATEAYFKKNSNGVVCETGDYLDSPLTHDEYKTVAYNPDVHKDGDTYWYNGGGFVSTTSSAYTDRNVVMWMDVDSDGAPTNNTIMFKVNRRTTATYNGNSVSVNQYRFRLKFYDGSGSETDYFFTFIINITNQAPSVTQVNRSFTMRAGDDLTVLTSYYDVFTGANDSRIADAYRNSTTFGVLDSRQNSNGYGNQFGDGSNNATGDGFYWKFADITTANAGEGEIGYSGDGKLHHDSTTNTTGKSVHLGYVGLANDDTPWRLRFINWTTSNDSITVYSQETLALSEEGAPPSGAAQKIALRVIAKSACTNTPFTVTISDGEGGVITCTLYITIVSSPPVALDPSNKNENYTITSGGLHGIKDPNDAFIFGTYIVPAEGTHEFNISGVGNVTARRVTTVAMKGVARDPDGDSETNNMRLYGNGEFIVNGQSIVSGADGIYRTDYFNIQPAADGRSFTITATGYNPNTIIGYEELKFRIADYGDSSYANTKQVTIRIFTLYSDLTNPTVAAKSDNDYTSYLGGSDAVNVKSYDVFYDPQNPTDVSKYAFIAMQGNAGNDDNTSSPIVDADAQKIGDARYNSRLYAFFDVDNNGAVKALSAETIRGMLDRNAAQKTFGLKADVNSNDYLIGGVLTDGTSISLTQSGTTRLNALLKYANFEFTSDGAALLFTPKASTLNSSDVLLYVEAEKPLGGRSYSRTDAVLNAGALFKLNVRDSAPQAVDGRHEVEGVKGDVRTLIVFNPEDRYSGLFMDSDAGDTVTVNGLAADGKMTDSEYDNVMSTAITALPGLDWAADPETGKPRAFDIFVNENGELAIRINRRVDYVVADVYMPKVSIPLRITGKDAVGEQVTTTVYLTIHNSDISAVEYYSAINAESMVGYSFGIGENEEYVMNVQLRYGTPLTVELNDILRDDDITGTAYDGDSYRFVSPKTQGVGYSFLIDEQIEVNWYALDADGNPNIDDTKPLATASPVGKDSLHITGILFNAVETQRDLTATVYVRVIDRAGNADIEENGLIIKINVVVMNDAPYILPGKETTKLYMVGSESKEPAGMLFFIGDFVKDDNTSDVVGDAESAKNVDTCLRISRQEARAVSKIYSPQYDSIPESIDLTDEILSSALFEVTIPSTLDSALIKDYCTRTGKSADFEKDNTNQYNQWFVVKPRRGFYGNGAIDITVVDGNANVKYDTLSTTFCLDVHVISNPDEVIESMTDIELACSKTKQLDINTLMPSITNKLSIDKGNADNSDNANSVFNQCEYYDIVSMGFQNDSDNSKATFTKLDAGGQLWELKAGNQITREPVRVEVNFALKNDKSVSYKKYYYLNIITNRSPQIKYTQVEFKRHSDGDADPLRDLNEANSIRLQAWQLFEDADDPDGTAIRFLSVKSQVSSIVEAKLIKDESGEYRYLELSFVGRGESEITVTVTDETGAPVQLKFVASNKDLPEPSLWVKIAASFEANTVLWIVIIGCVLLVLIIIIVIIAVVRKRKREREELEALLVSEMEIEEQMLRLAGGPSPTGYQSYGYLPGPDAPQPDPSMMLGAGADAPDQQLTALPPAQDGGAVPPDSDNGDMPM